LAQDVRIFLAGSTGAVGRRLVPCSLPELARTLGAQSPRRVPRWLGFLAARGVGVSMMTEVRGAANARARRELAWTPSRPSWRGGFAELADAAVRARAPAGTS
jgi:nucleoside-diphosphate-sugar epimerase